MFLAEFFQQVFNPPKSIFVDATAFLRKSFGNGSSVSGCVQKGVRKNGIWRKIRWAEAVFWASTDAQGHLR
jgi:hypothetical protein